MVRVAVLGASGNAGSEIVKDLASRGKYEITAVARNTENIPKEKGVSPVKADASKPAELAPVIKGSDVVISALHHDIKEPVILESLKKAGVTRAIIVGGAASLHVSPGGPPLIDAGLPEEYREFALRGIDFLNGLKTEKEVDWTFFSPPAEIFPGPKTGKFRTGDTVLLTDKDGNSKISFADYAIALVDELEAHKHPFGQFTAAY